MKIFDNPILLEMSNKKWPLPVIFIISCVLIILRRPDAIFLSQPWAEDGNIFLQQAIYHSWSSLLIPYGGYLHFIPRIVTNLSLYLGLANAPFFMNVSSIIIASLCAIFFSTKHFRFIIKNDFLRMICSFFIVITPGVPEITSNITNIQWFVTVFVILFIAIPLFRYDQYQKMNRTTKYFCSISLGFSFLTAPYTLVLFPVLVYVIIKHLLVREERRSLWFIIIPTSAIVSNVIFLMNFHSDLVSHKIIFKDLAITFVNAAVFGTIKLFYYNSHQVITDIKSLSYMIPIFIFGLIMASALKTKSKIEFYFLAFWLFGIFFTLVLRPEMIGPLVWLDLANMSGNERYYFILLISLFILFWRQYEIATSKTIKIIFLILIFVITVNTVMAFSLGPFNDMHYREMVKVFDPNGHQHCSIPINPTSWSFDIPCSSPHVT